MIINNYKIALIESKNPTLTELDFLFLLYIIML